MVGISGNGKQRKRKKPNQNPIGTKKKTTKRKPSKRKMPKIDKRKV